MDIILPLYNNIVGTILLLSEYYHCHSITYHRCAAQNSLSWKNNIIRMLFSYFYTFNGFMNITYLN